MTSAGTPARPRGRVDKQQAILAAAFTVFARTGYTQTRMDQIAAEAGVAKATVYSHFGDKEQVFRHAVRALSDAARQANLAVVERLAEPGADLPATLHAVGGDLVRCYCSLESRALRRLVCAEAGEFPDLTDIVDEVSGQVRRALADRFARLALDGKLRLNDPDLTAAQWAALLTGALPARYQFGVEPLPESEADTVAAAAATTFLAVFGP
ncbi:TetR/AcrR family transcriptional regulator [Nocardia flavorosea]|uniref:TetR/AcrR family transcriptional regulator n=1 Tax=Nocardia flavorosea TaxID=53429 RepID=UPI00189379B6|nr:TetR/AcrR family transcriptional regulator [Nocardia flavorosea]MBF6348849.1 TetR/AcrR family transcriptional regulator [Nocardia flavorosea]